MFSRLFIAMASFAALVAILQPPARAQVSTVGVEGLVQDASGSAISGARVSAVRKRTEWRAETSSRADGKFTLLALAPGEYTLTVEAGGFRTEVRSGVILIVGAMVSQAFRLEAGDPADIQMTEAKAEQLLVAESQISRAATQRDVEILPLVERRPILLAAFQPGVQAWGGMEDFSRVNGTRQGSNNLRLDGVDGNDPVAPRLGLSAVAINSDSVAQFRIVTSGGQAEFGRSAGAQVQMITRSGGTRWSGNAFEYYRNTMLNANDFFSNLSGAERPRFNQNLYGLSLGGPAVKDRTFVFGNFQGRRTARQITRNQTVLMPEVKAGLFRWYTPGTMTLQSFDIVQNDPRGRGVDARVTAVLAKLPDPNNSDIGDGLNTAGFRFNSPGHSREDQFTFRADHNLTPRHRLFSRLNWELDSSVDSLDGADARFPGQPDGTEAGRRWGYALGSDWTVVPRMANQLRFGYHSSRVALLRPARQPDAMLLSNSWTDPMNPAFAQERESHVGELTDHLTFVRGRHIFKTGLSLRFTSQKGSSDEGIYPDVTFARANGNTPPATIGPMGSSVILSADRQRFENLYNDLLGRMDRVIQTFYSDLESFQQVGSARVRNYGFREYGCFFQDDLKVRPNLTLNLGVRYEFYGVPFERAGLQGALDKAALINASARISDFAIQRSGEWYRNDYNNFAPRFGFAWDPWNNRKTVVRGSYGLFYDRLIGGTTNLMDAKTPGFSQTVGVFPNSAGTDVRVNDGIPMPARPTSPILRPPNSRATSVAVFNPELRTGYVSQYNLTVQREIFHNTVIEAGYVGSRGVKLFMELNLNQKRIEGGFLQAFREIQAFRANLTPVPASNTLARMFGSVNAAVAAIGGSALDQGLVGAAADTVDRNYYARYAAAGVNDFYLRNFPQFDQFIYGTNDGRSSSDSLQVGLRRQQGTLRGRADYAWSKSLDNISVDGDEFISPIDNFNLDLNKGKSDADRRHVFSSSWTYTLPTEKTLGILSLGWLNQLFGGWDVGLLALWESGRSFTVNSERQTAGAAASTWASYSGDRRIGRIDRRSDGVFWFTSEQIKAFTFPAAGEIGTSGRNSFTGPPYFDLDLALVRSFRLRDTNRVTFRAEVYNILNKSNFDLPGASLVSPWTLGKISATQGNPRTMQAALRYEF